MYDFEVEGGKRERVLKAALANAMARLSVTELEIPGWAVDYFDTNLIEIKGMPLVYKAIRHLRVPDDSGS